MEEAEPEVIVCPVTKAELNDRLVRSQPARCRAQVGAGQLRCNHQRDTRARTERLNALPNERKVPPCHPSDLPQNLSQPLRVEGGSLNVISDDLPPPEPC